MTIEREWPQQQHQQDTVDVHKKYDDDDNEVIFKHHKGDQCELSLMKKENDSAFFVADLAAKVLPAVGTRRRRITAN